MDQTSSGLYSYNKRADVESQMARWKGVLGEALGFHFDQAQATEVAIGVMVLNRMLDLGRPNSGVALEKWRAFETTTRIRRPP